MHVAIVEDDPVIAKAVVTAVREAGHECTWVPDGESAVRQNVLLSNDVVILDLMLPKMSGLEVLKAARDAGVRTPVILLTALGTVADKLAGFQSGADDYLVKPFAFGELVARIHALLRRSHGSAQVLTIGRLHLDLIQRRATVDGAPVVLTSREFDLLAYLARHAGTTVSRDTLARDVLHVRSRATPVDNVIEVNVSRLRARLAAAGCHVIRTVRGIGYQLTAPA